MSSAYDIFFEYLKDILYAPEKAKIDIDALPPEARDLGEGMKFLEQCVKEQRKLGSELAAGRIDTEPPAIENVLASPMKSLQGALRHVTWQTQQVAKGDYTQKLDFMGDFSVAFNEMTKQLENRENSLILAKEKLEAQNRVLEQTQDMLVDLTVNSPEIIVIIDNVSNQPVFLNRKAQELRYSSEITFQIILQKLLSCPRAVKNGPVSWDIDYNKTDFTSEGIQSVTFLEITSRSILWNGNLSTVHFMIDVTAQKHKEQIYERMVNTDELTGLYNRRYGMVLMEKCVENHMPFVVAMVDIDYLKYCNDTFGHLSGDNYIKLIADNLKKISGQRTVCRIGGDEFMVVRTGTDPEAFEQEFLKIRDNLISSNTCEHPTCFSFGTSFYTPSGNKKLSEVLGEADYKMYQFKFAYKKDNPFYYKDSRI